MNNMHTVNLVMGDWSADGHGMTETITIKCNVSRDELVEAYKVGSLTCGVDLKAEVACDYDDSSFPVDIIEKLEACGFNSEGLVEEGDAFIEPELYWNVWMFIAKLGNPAIEFDEVAGQDIKIGGYGMFQL